MLNGCATHVKLIFEIVNQYVCVSVAQENCKKSIVIVCVCAQETLTFIVTVWACSGNPKIHHDHLVLRKV